MPNFLLEGFEPYHNSTALIFKDGQLSYEELDCAIEAKIKDLNNLATYEIISTEDRLEFTIKALACLRARKLFIPIESPDSLHATRRVKQLKMNLSDDRLKALAFCRYALLTSGSSGSPKAVFYDEKTFEFVLARIQHIFKFTAESKELSYLPLQHSDGFNRVLACLNNGAQVRLAKLINVSGESELVEGLKWCNQCFISWPILQVMKRLKTIGVFGDNKTIEIGSHCYSNEDLYHLDEVFPKSKIIKHYGLTECSRAMYIDNKDSNYFVENCVGKLNDQDVACEVTNEKFIRLTSPHCANYILADKTLTELRGSLLTCDLGEIKDGYLFLKGRGDDFVSSFGAHYHLAELEKLLEEGVGNLNFCLKKVVSNGNDHCKLFLARESWEMESEVRSFLQKLPSYMKPSISKVEQISRDANGKVIKIT